MKLVLVGPVYPYRGGIAHYTTMLYQAMHKQHHDVLLVSFKRQYPHWLFPGRSDRDPSEKPLKVEGACYWIDSLNPLTWLNTFWRISRYQPDAIILQWWTSFWAPVWYTLGILNRFFLRRPLVVICHNVLPHEARWWDTLLAQIVLRWGDRFVVQSAEEKRRLESLIPGAQIAVVPHPMYDMFAGEKIPKEEARKQLGLPLETPVLLFFGIVRQYKGLRDILVTLPDIQARLGRVILLVAGEFWENKQSYIELIERLGIGDFVVLEDRYIPNEEVALYFSAADVLIAPYRQATGSGVVQMAHGLGVPVITTHVCESETGPKAIIDGETCLVIPPGDSGSLVDAISRFFQTDCQSRIGEQLTCGERLSSWDCVVERVVGAEGAEDLRESDASAWTLENG